MSTSALVFKASARLAVAAVALVILISPPSLRSQVCGDMNGDGSTSVFDVVSIVRFLHDDSCIVSGMLNVRCHNELADFDGYCGISIGDALFLSEFIFEGGPPPSECSICSSAGLPISESDTIRITSSAVPENPTLAEIVVSGVFHESPAGISTLGCSVPLNLQYDGAPITIASIEDISTNPPGALQIVDVDDLTGNVRISILDLIAQNALAEFTLTIMVALPSAGNRQLIAVDTAAAPPLNWPVTVRETNIYSPGLALYRPIFEGLSIAPCPDIDGDSVCDADDNCPTVSNPGQEDNNGNGIGDAC